MEDEEASRPPVLLWIVVGLLAVIGALSVVRWVFSIVGTLVVLAVVVGLIAVVVSVVRAGSRAKS